jgi:O-antigen/teichoic acid export membrane protein
MCIGQAFFARLLFGDAEFKTLVIPLAVFLLANALHAIVFSFYRGRLQMERANFLQFLNFAVFPLVATLVIWTGRSIATMFLTIGVLTLVCTLAMALPIFRERPLGTSHERGVARELLRYGTARIPGDIALGALFTVAPIIASHYVPLPRLAPLLLGLGILNVLGTSANPLNQVLLSKVSMMLAEGRMQEAASYIGHLVTGAVEVSVFACLQIVIFADVVVRIWVGPKYLSEMLLVRILLLAIPFYLLHTALRCVIDAASVTAYNTRNILFTFGLVMASVLVEVRTVPAHWVLDAIAGALLVALVMLAVLTVLSLKKLYPLKLAWSRSGSSLLFALALGGASFALRWVHGFDAGIVEFIIVQIVAASLFAVFLHLKDSPWFAFVRDGLLQKIPAAPRDQALGAVKSA